MAPVQEPEDGTRSALITKQCVEHARVGSADDVSDKTDVSQGNALQNEPAITKTSVLTASLLYSAFMIDGFTQWLAVSRGSTGIIQGLIVSIRQLGTALFQPLWGYLADNFGRRRFLAGGLLVMAVVGILMPLVPTPEMILALVAVQAIFGTMLIPAWNAWISDRTVKSNRAKTFGKIGMMASWCSVIAMFAAMIAMELFDPDRVDIRSYRIPMFFGSMLAVTAALMVPKLSGTCPSRVKPLVDELEKPGLRSQITERIKGFDPKFKRLLLIEGCFYFTWAAAWPLFPYALLGATDSWIELGIMQLAWAIPAGLAQFFGGKLADEWGRRKIILITRITLVVPPTTAALAVLYHNFLLLLIGNVLVGFTLGATTVAVSSFIFDVAPEDQRASYFSTHLLVVGVTGFLASTIMGGILQLLAGDSKPEVGLLATLLIIVSCTRVLSWCGYFFLPETIDLPEETGVPDLIN